jgi:hypothetical protein
MPLSAEFTPIMKADGFTGYNVRQFELSTPQISLDKSAPQVEGLVPSSQCHVMPPHGIIVIALDLRRRARVSRRLPIAGDNARPGEVALAFELKSATADDCLNVGFTSALEMIRG